MSRNIILVVLLLLSVDLLASYNENQLIVTKDLRWEWRIYDYEEERHDYFSETSEAKSISFDVSLKDYSSQWLFLDLPKGHFVWIDSFLVKSTVDRTEFLFSTDSLWEKYSHNDINISIFSDDFDHSVVKTHIVRTSNLLTVDTVGNPVAKRNGNTKRNGLIVISILALLSVVVYRSINYRVFDEFLAVNRAFMVRQNFDLVNSKNSFSAINVAYMFFYSLVLTASMLNYFLFSPNHYELPGVIAQFSIFELGFYVLAISLLLIILKLPLIGLLSSLFGIVKISNLHFYIYLRHALIFVLCFFAVTVFNGISEGKLFKEWGHVFQILLIFGGAIRLIVLFLVLNKIFTFRKIHLFTYLCGTDAIPLLLFLNYFLK